MADYNPTLPGDSTQDKRLRVSSRQRVDAVDYTDIGQVLSSRVANWLRSVAINSTDIILRGFRVVEQAVPAMAVDIKPESGQNYSAAMQAGHVIKEVAAVVAKTIDSEPSASDRYDLVLIRYGEDQGDQDQRAQITNPQITQVIDEAPGTGTGDGVTERYDFANNGVINATIVARVNGVPVNARLARGAGAAGSDQIVFSDPPAAGAPIRVDYYYMTGGAEQLVGIDTRFTSVVDYQITKGTPGGGVPSTPAGWIKVAEVGPINNGVATITNSLITPTRQFWSKSDPGVAATFGTVEGSLRDWMGVIPVWRDGTKDMDLAAATTFDVKRSVNATDEEDIQAWHQRGESAEPTTVVTADGHIHRRYRQIVDDFYWLNLTADTTTPWQKEDLSGGGGTVALFSPASLPQGIVQIITAGALGDKTCIRSSMRVFNLEDSSTLGVRGHMICMAKIPDTTKGIYQLGLAGDITSEFDMIIMEIDASSESNFYLSRYSSAGARQEHWDTGVAKNAAFNVVEIHEVDAGKYQLFINGSLVATTTSNLGGATDVDWIAAVEATDATATQMQVDRIELNSAAHRLF
jgi:hypothetical protein